MRTTKLMILGLTLAVSVLTAAAQNAGGGQNRAGGANGALLPPSVAAFDTDADGVLSATEIAHSSAILSQLDKNGDHQITAEELCPYGRAGGRGWGCQGAPMGLPACLAVLDPDGDGVLSAQEIADAPAALKQLDKNNDGQISADEVRPGRGPGGPGSRGPGWGCGGRCPWNSPAGSNLNPTPRRRGANRR